MQIDTNTRVRTFFILIFVIVLTVTFTKKSDVVASQTVAASQTGPVNAPFCGYPSLPEVEENVEDEELAKFYCNCANLVFEEYRKCRGEGRELLKKDAKKLYNLAAQYGSLDAHYLLTYQYIPESRESKIAHLHYAASRGHLEALESLSETLMFRCNSLDYFDPQLVLEAFDGALEYHPGLKEEIANFDLDSSYDDYQLAGRYKLIEMSCELQRGLGPFDVQTFRDTYGITEEEENKLYGIWLLAEEASIEGGRFGEMNQNLIYHLVLRGGWAPMEYVGALKTMHATWKTGEEFTFDICTYMTSSVAANLCASRKLERSVETYQANTESIAESVQGALKDKVIKASAAYIEFVEYKVYNEENHYGTWKYYWAANSYTRQLEYFVVLLQSVHEKTFQLVLPYDYEKIVGELDAIHKHNLDLANNKGGHDKEAIQTTQRLWTLYRDSAMECLFALDPSISVAQWRTWLTQMRVYHLQGGK